ncbi:MAG: response regulator transcription factor [Burkholderiaceae bacterium]|nr:response regulator transcription factor [Burkholderiaceae bacterium]
MHILIVDDHPLFREGMKILLSSLDPAVLMSEAGTVAEAVAQAATESPDLVLLDMNLPGVSRLDALRQVKDAYESAAVVVVSGDEDPLFVRACIEAGAAGYIPKTTDSALTIQALRLVLAHGIYLPRSALGRPATARQPGGSAGWSELQLSDRQMAVLERMLRGKPNKIIARDLNIAVGTVKAHLWAVYQALGVTSRSQAMYRVHELGLFDGGRSGSQPERSGNEPRT